MSKSTPKKKTRDLGPAIKAREGVPFELADGGSVTVVAAAGNTDLLDAHEEAIAAARERLGYTIDMDLPTSALIRANTVAKATLIKHFDGFTVGDQELLAADVDGKRIEENFRLLMEIPAIRDEIDEKVAQLDKLVRRNREVAEKNSPASSAGTSDTETTSPTS